MATVGDLYKKLRDAVRVKLGEKPADGKPLDDQDNDDGPSADESKESARISRLIREALQGQEISTDGKHTLRQWWTIAGRRFLGDHWDYAPQKGVKQVTINKTTASVITHVAAATETAPRIRLEGVESGDEPDGYFVKPRAGRRLARIAAKGFDFTTLALERMCEEFTPGQLRGEEALTPDQFDALMEPYQPPPNPAMPGMMPPPVVFLRSDDDAFRVDDKLKAAFAQRVFDVFWDKSNGDYYFTENEFLCNIFGHQAWYVEYDAEKRSFMFRNPHVCNVWIDPKATRIEDADYILWDQLISVEEAKSQYPQWADEIDRAKRTSSIDMRSMEGSGTSDTVGTGRRPMEGGGVEYATANATTKMGSLYTSINWQRDMVVIRTCWERHYMVPLTPEEAMERGKVRMEPWPAEAAMEAKVIVGTPTDVVDPMNPAGIATVMTYSMPDTGEAIEEGGESWPNRYVLAENGEPVSEDDDAWPKRSSIRQQTFLKDINRRINECECPYYDFPFAWNISTPIQYSPYGMGVPYNIEDLSKFACMLVTSINNIIRNGAFRTRIMPASLKTEIERVGGVPNSRPDQAYGIDDQIFREIFSKGIGTGFEIPAAEVPEQAIRLLSMVLSLIDEVSGNVAVLQGRSPGSEMSGRALNELSSNAKGVLGFKAKFGEWAIQRMAKIVLNAIIEFVPREEIAKYMKEYPPGVFDMLHASMCDTDWNISVQVVSGRAATKRATLDETIAKLKTGLVSLRTAQERVEEDPDLEARRAREQASMPLGNGAAPETPAAGNPNLQSSASPLHQAGDGTAMIPQGVQSTQGIETTEGAAIPNHTQ